MKKKVITPAQLKEIIELRQMGANWSGIGNALKIDRRFIKRAYEEWQADRLKQEQESARFRVAAIAFNQHIDDLIRIAGAVVAELKKAFSLQYIEMSAEDFLSRLWQQDLLHRFYADTGEQTYPGDWSMYSREQQLLFDSLKEHTHGQFPWEAFLADWAKAKDGAAGIIPVLREEINQKLAAPPLKMIIEKILAVGDEHYKEQDFTEMLSRLIYERLLLRFKNPVFEIKIQDGKMLIYCHDINFSSKVVKIITVAGASNKPAGDLVANLNAAFKKLTGGETVSQLFEQVKKVTTASSGLGENLIPVKLRALLQNSRCSCCPV